MSGIEGRMYQPLAAAVISAMVAALTLALTLVPIAARSAEHTAGLQSHRDLHSFPTRRSSDLDVRHRGPDVSAARCGRDFCHGGSTHSRPHARTNRGEIGRAHGWTPVTPRSTLFPYTTLFRSGCQASRAGCISRSLRP